MALLPPLQASPAAPLEGNVFGSIEFASQCLSDVDGLGIVEIESQRDGRYSPACLNQMLCPQACI